MQGWKMKKYGLLLLLVLFSASCADFDDVNWKTVTAEELKEMFDDVNEQDENGNTALMYAVKYNNLSVVEALIKEGADVNVRNETGNTPLMYAAEYENSEAFDILIKAGADVNVRNKAGKTAQMIKEEQEFFNNNGRRSGGSVGLNGVPFLFLK